MDHLPLDIVVTAARASQARIYEAQIGERARMGRLPSGSRWHVVTDPGGRRIGSGLATAVALHAVVDSSVAGTRRGRGDPLRHCTAAAFQGRRILVIHSGGDSRRLPAFATLGKTFAPLPGRAGKPPTTVFDLLVDELADTPLGPEGGVIVASGDTSVEINSSLLAAGRELRGRGVDGFAIEGSVAEAGRHGVYVQGRGTTVHRFVQKPSPATLKRLGALRAGRQPLIDIGVVRFSPDAAAALVRGCGDDRRGLLAAALRGQSNPIDLYRHVLEALPSAGRRGTSVREYVDAMGPASAEEAEGLTELAHSLRAVPFRVHVIDRTWVGPGAFMHVGTTRQYLDLAHERRARVIASAACAVEAPALARVAIVGSLGVRVRTKGDSLVAAAPAALSPLDLPRGIGLVVLPIGRADWATVLFHVDDDGKTPIADGGTLLGRSLATWCRRAGVAPDEIAAAGATSWDARLWTIEERPSVQTWMIDGRPAPRSWITRRRRSLRELVELVDARRQVAFDRGVADAARSDGAATAPRLEALSRARSRIKAAFMLRDRSPRASQRRTDEAFRVIESLVTMDVQMPRTPPRAAIPHDVAVWASAPARIDLAGGWSDTPPICNEIGGTVVNAAIELDGRAPVHAIAKLAERPEISLHSVDLGLSATFLTTDALLTHDDPRDWTALAKAALRLAGIAPPSREHRLDRWLERFGGGLSLSLFAAVPKGSGLGTSSILGATALACLDRVCGRDDLSEATRPDLICRTSALEQMIATRGGWQDQVGGIAGGFNLLRTAAGLKQVPNITPLAPPQRFVAELEARSVLCFTGLRRLARDILQRVVGRYLVDEGAAATVRALKLEAETMADAVRSGDLDRFADVLGRYWRHKTTLDPHATTPAIEEMVRPFRRELSAWSMPGAGGGGFVLLVARSPQAATRIRGRLTKDRPNDRSRVVPCAFTPHGLSVSML